MEEKQPDTGVSLAFLVNILRRRIVWLLLAAVIGGGALFCWCQFLATPRYSSTAKFQVEIQNPTGAIGATSSAYLAGTSMIAANRVEEVTGNVFLTQVSARYESETGKKLSPEVIKRRLSVKTVQETSVFTVRVSASTPEEAYALLKVIENVAPDYFNTVEPGASEKPTLLLLIDEGNKATAPDFPNKKLLTAAGAVGAFVLLYFIFWLVAVLDKTVYGEEQLKEHFKQPVVGAIPEWHVEGETTKWTRAARRLTRREGSEGQTGNGRFYKGRLLDDKTPFSIAESFKTLRTNLTYVATDGKTPVFGVTSDFAAAGKSLVISNLAVSFAQLGKKVLLIDADMRCPVQHNIFDIHKKVHGLSEALAGIETDPLTACVLHEVQPGLDLMVSGHRPPNPSELLSSERMVQLMAAVREKYDYVFIDLPPILETTDAGVLAATLSGFVIVVRAGYSNVDSVGAAAEGMLAIHANVVGFVLNDVNQKRGYGYYSHYGKYGKYSKYSKYNKYNRYSRYASTNTPENGAEPETKPESSDSGKEQKA